EITMAGNSVQSMKKSHNIDRYFDLCLFRRAPLLLLAASVVCLLCYAAISLRNPCITEIKGLNGIRHHTGTLAFSSDGTYLALPKTKGQVELWNLKTKQARLLVTEVNRSEASAQQVAFSAHGQLLAVDYSDKRVTIFDLVLLKELVHSATIGFSW